MKTHTKRTPEFDLKIKALAAKVLRGTANTTEDREEIARILREHTTDSSCTVKAADNEPIFTLRGKDDAAIYAVGEWIRYSREHGLHADKLDDAVKCQYEMLTYRGGILPK